MPICRRTKFTSTAPSVMSSPKNAIRPRSTSSSRFTQRSSVDLPEPEAPIRQITSWGATAKSIPFSTWV